MIWLNLSAEPAQLTDVAEKNREVFHELLRLLALRLPP